MFKAIWLLETDEHGFMVHNKIYSIYKITSDNNHYEFINEHGLRDVAHKSFFKKLKMKKN